MDCKYKTILADPPWPYDNVDGPRAAPDHRPNSWDSVAGSVSSANRYGSMSIKDLCALAVPSAASAHLYLWTTNSFMAEAHEIARAWGFTPKTIITWGKVKEDGTPSMKTGYYFRGATEHVLFAVKGNLRLMGGPEPTLFLSPRLPHSKKPAWFYEMVERQSPGPYLEMFARPITTLFPKMEGWHVWGNEVSSDVQLATEQSVCSLST